MCSRPSWGRSRSWQVALEVRFRAEVAGRRFDDAIRTAKTMLALGRHLGEHPSEVANLIGLWVVHLSLDTLEEMVQQPGCPNLYWARNPICRPRSWICGRACRGTEPASRESCGGSATMPP